MKKEFEIHVNRANQCAALTVYNKKTTSVYHAFVGSCMIDEYFSKDTKKVVTDMRRMIKRKANAGGDARNYVERY